MSNFDYINYKGNAIFRNQPNHKYFDVPLENDQDVLFQRLNEIEPHFLKPEQKEEILDFAYDTVIDPRTKKPLPQLLYDHTKKEKTEIFSSPKKSSMTIKQHEVGVRVVNALQHFKEVEEEDMFNWHRLQTARIKEMNYFQNYVLELNQSCKEKMYVPCQKFLELYQKWYKSKVTKLMKTYPEQSYNTHLGLPQVKQCKNVLSGQQVEIITQEIISKLGDECHWQDRIKEEIEKFRHSISAYVELYTNSEDLKDSLEDSLQNKFECLVEQKQVDCPLYYIPFESLLFLVTAGDYVDIPSEMFLNIKEAKCESGDFMKHIIMDQPLPARNAGWHTYHQVINQAATALISTKQTRVKDDENVQTTHSFKKSAGFKVFTIEDFIKKSKLNAEKLCKFSKILTKWKLGNLEEDVSPQEIYTSLDNFTSNKEITLKLEFKPKFGCEVLTKYEMLKEWFKLKLLPSITSNCYRLDITNYKILLEEPISLHILEQNLHSVYHINCKQLLNNLYEFLKMLYSMPLGHYMLRYNPKFKDKLMLCKPSQEITQNTIHLHQLLQADITDLQFMSEPNFLPIDGNICSIMHLEHQILPAAFSPHKTDGQNFYKPVSGHKLKKPIVQHKELKTRLINKTKMKRIRRRERVFEAFKAKKNELKVMQQEMELDSKMLNM